MKRVNIVDMIRSIATLGVVLLHSILVQWEGNEDARILPGSPPPDAMVQIIFYIVSMGGFYFIISGLVNALAIDKRVKKNGGVSTEIFFGSMIMGLTILVAHYIYVFIVGEERGILYLLILNDPSQPILWGDALLQASIHRDALGLIGWNLILISGLFLLLYRKDGYHKTKRNYIILFIIGTIVLILTPFVRDMLFQTILNLSENKKYFSAASVNVVVGDWFPLFPYFGYGCYGAIFGIAINRDEYKGIIQKITLVIAILWALIGFTLIYTQFGALYTGLYEEYSTRGMYFRSFLQYSQLGVILLVIIGGLNIWDFVSEKRYNQIRQRQQWLFRLGNISLTIFLYEGIVRIALGHFAYWLIPTWAQEIWSVAIFGVINCVIWVFLTKLWEKIGYVGSLEWGMIYLVKLLSGKQSERFVRNIKQEPVAISTDVEI